MSLNVPSPRRLFPDQYSGSCQGWPKRENKNYMPVAVEEGIGNMKANMNEGAMERVALLQILALLI